MAKRRKRGVRGAGTIAQLGAGGDTWQFRYRDESGERISKTGLTYLEAVAAQERLKRGAAPFDDSEPDTKLRTITDVLPAFWEWRKGRGLKSVRDDLNRWKHLHALEPLALTAVSDVELGAVVKAMQSRRERKHASTGRTIRAKPMSPASIGLVLNLLSSLYKFARVSNPVSSFKIDHRKVIKSKHDPKKVPFLADAAKSKALQHEVSVTGPVYGIAYAVSRWAGLRPGEVRALEWTDVDLVKGRIDVRVSERGGKKDTTKSDKPRMVPIGAYLVDTLKAWREKNPDAELVCPALPRKMTNDGSTRASATKPRNWRPYLNEALMNDALADALAALGLEPMTLYQVGRHSFASDWVIQGRNIYELKEVMGHASITTTERYAHLREEGIKPLT